MNSETAKITIEDVPLVVEYDYFPGCPQTIYDPGEPKWVEIQSITTDADFSPLFAESISMAMIEDCILSQIKREADADEGEAKYKQWLADREAV